MDIVEYTIKNKVLSVIAILLIIGGGLTAYQGMPRFEDPEFTIRLAPVVTKYPGASPMEVAEEITSPLEQAIQQLQEVDSITSVSTAGSSEIKVEIKYEFSKTKADLQMVFTKLRNTVKDAERSLPPGASTPMVVDDFGDVFGFYYLITGDGFTQRELRAYAKELQTEILQVPGVAKVSLGGEQTEAIYVEVTRQAANTLGVSLQSIYGILDQQNAVVPAGDVDVGDLNLVIDPSGGIKDIDDIRNLLVTTSSEGELIRLRDVATVTRGYQTPAKKLFRYNQQPAIALGIAAVSGGNVVEVGQAVTEKIVDAQSRRPLGIEVQNFYNQGEVVKASVNDFVLNVIAALAIVVITLLIFMGMRSALVIGAILILTILATLATMELSDIPMHRISLGALIIALGMMVDNAIVVTEGILVGTRKGLGKLAIASSVVRQTKWPLLGGTLVGILAFAPIGLAPGDTAEFTGHLFWVILIALLYSWLFAITLTPLFCFWLFPELEASENQTATETIIDNPYTQVLNRLLNAKTLVFGITIGLFIVSVWGFQFVKSGFFPDSTTPQVVVDYWLPQGTNIQRTQRDVLELEKFMAALPSVNAVKTTIGGGGLRYMLVYGAESQNASYAQLLLRVDDYQDIDALMPKIQGFMDERFPDAQGKVWRFVIGPGGGSKIETVFHGADPVVLRALAEEAESIMRADGRALSVKNDWRHAVSFIEPRYSESLGRRAGISREDLVAALQTHFSGRTVGVYRESDDLLPIISRAPLSDRQNIEDIRNIQVLSSITGRNVPITQVTESFSTQWRDGLVRREDRQWTIKAQSDPYPDELASELLSRLRPKIEAIDLPNGYSLEWGGEFGNSEESNSSLAAALPLGLLAMVITVFVLFGTVRQPIVIWLVVPLALIGVVFGLIVTDMPLEFMGILGLLSLSGLLIKNGIVLVDQIDVEIGDGKARYDAVLDASSSRVRPVLMGALTTVLGVVPLFFDPFFKSMSVVLIFGLSFATLLTLVVVPVLYAAFFNIKKEETQHA
jgi:multidrug efflux pump subunit AcrB